jgi:hypothetical protein
VIAAGRASREAEQRAERAGVMLDQDDEPPEPRVRHTGDLRGRAY